MHKIPRNDRTIVTDTYVRSNKSFRYSRTPSVNPAHCYTAFHVTINGHVILTSVGK